MIVFHKLAQFGSLFVLLQGFTAGLYAFYRDMLGRPLTDRDANTGKPKEFNYEYVFERFVLFSYL